jgi:hypothetical protein
VQLNGVSIDQIADQGHGGADSHKSDLELSPSGEFLKYEWSQASGGSLSVFPENDFLKEKISATSSGKPPSRPSCCPALRRFSIIIFSSTAKCWRGNI